MGPSKPMTPLHGKICKTSYQESHQYYFTMDEIKEFVNLDFYMNLKNVLKYEQIQQDIQERERASFSKTDYIPFHERDERDYPGYW